MADENIVTNIVVKSDFSNLIADLNKVSSALVKLQDELQATNKNLAVQADAINRNFASTLRSTGQFSTHFVSLSSDVDKFGMQLEKGQIKLRQFFRVYAEHSKTTGGLIRDLAKQQVQLQSALLQPLGRNAEGLMQYNVHIPRGLDLIKNKTAIAKQELQIMNRVIQEGANQLINWGKNTQWAGRQLTVGLTVPMAAFGKAAADAFRTADEQLVRLTKVYGGIAATSSSDLLKIRKDVAATAKELSKSLGSSFNETLGLAADIAATGKTGNELLGSVRETTRLAVLGEVDRQEAMKATLAIQTAFNQNTSELSDTINFLNAVENQTSTSLADLIEAIPKAGPVVKGLGGDVKDLALYLTAMREGGINASEGANALKSTLASLINPTKVATNMFASLGIDLKGIVAKNAGDLTGTILQLQAALDGLAPLQRQQAIEQLFGKFQFARINALFENLGKQGSQTLQVLDLMKASTSELANIAGRELGQVTESASGRYRRAVEGLKADLAGIGDQFLTINTHLINFVDGIIKFMNKLPGPIKSVLSFVGMLTATAGPIIMLTGVLGNFFGYIIKGASHFKSLFKGGEGWKLLTPEILAAQKAGTLIEKTFYSDAEAAAVLKNAVQNLAMEYEALAVAADKARVASTNPTVSTTGGTMIIPGRVVNPNNPYAGQYGSRAATHMNPVSKMTQQEKMAQTIFGVVPGPIPVNQRIGANPQIMTMGDLPVIPGLTQINKVSTGVVASEAAKWHSMTGMLSMLSKREVKALRKEIVLTGTMSQEFIQTYATLHPVISQVTQNAAKESQLILAQLKAGKLTVDQARAQIVAINAQMEAMMVQGTQQVAQSLGRTVNLTTLPLTNQPVVNAAGKSNVKEMFKPNRSITGVIDKIARILGVRTYGAGYSTETTIPKKFQSGGELKATIVDGPRSDRTDTQIGTARVGDFVLNRNASDALLGYQDGGEIMNVALTPGEIIFHNPTKEQLDVLNQFNSAYAAGGMIRRSKSYYGAMNPIIANYLSQSRMFSGFRSPGTRYYRASRGRYDTTGATTQSFAEPGSIIPFSQYRQTSSPVYSDINNRNYGITPVGSGQALTHAFVPSYIRRLRSLGYGPDDMIPVNILRSVGIPVPSGAKYSTLRALSSVWVKTSKRFNEAVSKGLPETNEKRTGWRQNWTDVTSTDFQSLLIKLKQMNVPISDAQRITTDAANKLNNLIRNHKGPMSESDWGKYVNSAEIGSMSKFYRPRTIAANRGGKIPGYALGGLISRRKHNYGIKSLREKGWWPSSMPGQSGQGMSSGVAPFIGMSVGTSAGAAIGGNTGAILGSIIGSFLPSLIGKTLILLKNLNNIKNVVFSIKNFIKAWSIPTAIITGIFLLGQQLYNLRKQHEELGKANRLAMGGTASSYASVGLTNYKSLTDRMKEMQDARELEKARTAQYLASGKGGPSQISLTVAQLKDAVKNAKENQKEYVNAINALPQDKVIRFAANLKAQFVAMGMTAQEAANQIYAIVKASNKADYALRAVASADFGKVTDQATALEQLFNNLAAATTSGNFNVEEFTRGLDSLFNALMIQRDKLMQPDKKTGQTITEAEATKKIMEQINKIKSSGVQLSSKEIENLKSQNLVYASILNNAETLSSIMAKLTMYESGLGNLVDLQKMSANEAIIFASNLEKVQQVIETDFGSTDSGKKLNAAIIAANGNLKTQTDLVKNLSELNTDAADKRLKEIDKEIAAINKLAEARIKAIQDEIDADNYDTQLKKKKLEYQTALAAGDVVAAQQAKLDLDLLTKKKNQEDAINAIREKQKADVEKRDAEKQDIQEKKDRQAAALQNAQTNLTKAQSRQQDLTNLKQEVERLILNYKVATAQAEAGNPEGTKKQIEAKNALASLLSASSKSKDKNIKEFADNLFAEMFPKGLDTLNVYGGPDKFTATAEEYLKKQSKMLEDDKTFSQAVKDFVAAVNKFAGTTGGIKEITRDYGNINYNPWDPRTWANTANITKLIKGEGLSKGSIFTYKGKTYTVKGTSGVPELKEMAQGGYIKSYADAGMVKGPGTGTSDSIPAYLSNGEYVIKAAAVQQYGAETFDAYNAQRVAKGGYIRGYANGGMAPSIGTPDPKQSLLNRFLFGTKYVGGNTELQKNEILLNPTKNMVSKALSGKHIPESWLGQAFTQGDKDRIFDYTVYPLRNRTSMSWLAPYMNFEKDSGVYWRAFSPYEMQNEISTTNKAFNYGLENAAKEGYGWITKPLEPIGIPSFKPGDIWAPEWIKSVTKDLDFAKKIAVEGGTSGGMTKAIAKIIVDPKVRGIPNFQELFPNFKLHEGVIAPFTKYIFQGINKNAHEFIQQGYGHKLDEYVFHATETYPYEQFLEHSPRYSTGFAPGTLPQRFPQLPIVKKAMGGYIGPNFNVPRLNNVDINGMPRYQYGGPVAHYNMGGITVNAAQGQSEQLIADMVMQKFNDMARMSRNDAYKTGMMGRAVGGRVA